MYIEESWFEELKEEFSLPYMEDLKKFLFNERQTNEVYPPEERVFSAFFETPFHEVKVVIVGQDPYHGQGQAEGLSFSVAPGLKFPPSLKNIFKEVASDVGALIPTSGSLLPWAKQGVFLLNATLTVRSGEPKSHYGKGWERFTDTVIEKLLLRKEPIVFLLWGKSAQEKGQKILVSDHHKVFMAAHPSPYAVSGFFGCRHFSKANEWLKKWGKKPINWDLSSS